MKNLWFFIKQLKTYKINLLVGILLSLILTAASITLFSLSGWFITAAGFAGLSATLANQFNYFLPAGSIRFLALIRIASRYADRVINHDYTFKILTTLRTWFYQSLIPLSPTHLYTFRSGDIQNQFINDIETLDHLYLRVVSPLLVALMTLLGICIFIHFYSKSLTCVLFITTLLVIIPLPLLIGKLSLSIGESIVSATARLRTQALDSIQGLTEIILNKPKNQWTTHLTHENHLLLKAQGKLASLKGFVLGIISLISGLSLLFTLMIGLPLVQTHHLTSAQLAMILLCVIAAFEQLTPLPLALLGLGKTSHAAKRILKTTQSPPAIEFPSSSICTISDTPDIQIENLSFHYPKNPTWIIKNLNVNIPFKETIAVTGTSGVGKSTLLQLIARVFEPTRGRILLNGHDISSFSVADYRKQITLVNQRVHIFNSSIRNNVTLMNNTFDDQRIMEVLSLLKLDTLIAELPNGLNTQMGNFGKQFSGGQIRRFALARALLYDAPIQLWDEPTTGLNNTLIEEIWDNLIPILKSKTVIIASHHPTLLKKIPNQIALTATSSNT